MTDYEKQNQTEDTEEIKTKEALNENSNENSNENLSGNSPEETSVPASDTEPEFQEAPVDQQQKNEQWKKEPWQDPYGQNPYGQEQNPYNQNLYGQGQNPYNNQNPYGQGQNPYNQNPYGQGQNPYNQNPYGQGQNPYNQNPYGQGQNPYNNQNPYGQGQNPYNQNPYGQGQNPYNQNPYGQGQNPYNQNPYQGGPRTNPPGKGNTYANLSLMSGLFGLLTVCCGSFPLTIIMGVGAICFAMISKKSGPLSGTAIAGIVLGALSIIGGIITFLYLMAFTAMMQDPEAAAAFNQVYEQMMQQLQQ